MSEKFKTAAPLVISASRVTDIPACFPEFLVERLKAGFVMRRNPFNGRFSTISFAKARFLVLWSKNPAPLLSYLEEVRSIVPHLMLHFTLNDYEKEDLEPGMPPLEERLETFRTYSKILGPQAVIWRADPLIKTRTLSTAELCRRLESLAGRLEGLTSRLIVSLVDTRPYPQVKKRCQKAGIELLDFEASDLELIGSTLKKIQEQHGLRVQTCAELPLFTAFGIFPGACIDYELLRELAAGDENALAGLTKTRDQGQRQLCLCTKSRDIGMPDTCFQGCRYCYANKGAVPKEQQLNSFDRFVPFLHN